MLLVFVLGILLFLYPFYINALNHFLDQQRMAMLQAETKSDNEQRQKELEKKNKQISEQGLMPNSVDFGTKGTAVTDTYYKKHVIGKISIPSIHIELPLFDETNDSLLQLGATVVQGTSYPTGEKNTHTVIAAHSGLPNRELFTNLEDVKVGNQFVLTVLGNKYAYEVERIKVVLPDDTSSIKIEPDKNLVTLLTCTPYMINTHWLLVTGHRIPYTDKVAATVEKGKEGANLKEALILVGTTLIVCLIVVGFGRMMYAYLLSKKRISLAIQIVNHANESLIHQRIQLYDKRGKKALKRNGAFLEQLTTEEGKVLFQDLPGGIYQIHLINQKRKKKIGKMGVKQLRQMTPKLYKMYDPYQLLSEEDGVFRVMVPFLSEHKKEQ